MDLDLPDFRPTEHVAVVGLDDHVAVEHPLAHAIGTGADEVLRPVWDGEKARLVLRVRGAYEMPWDREGDRVAEHRVGLDERLLPPHSDRGRIRSIDPLDQVERRVTRHPKVAILLHASAKCEVFV